MLDSRIRELLDAVKQGLEGLYGERLQGVYLFGSYALGVAQSGSDVDVLIVLDEVTHYFGETQRTGRLISSLSLAYDVSISRVFVSRSDWKDGSGPFLVNVREAAIAA